MPDVFLFVSVSYSSSFVCFFVCLFVCMNVCMHVYMYVCIFTVGDSKKRFSLSHSLTGAALHQLLPTTGRR